ncbi:spore coat protein [Caldibacillus lycopersici]|uniref:Spore coat protein n=1 Tax=Perspicuibacillus lycopersici TaxID=1325689 RepID=A0AAE3LU27_9BACI|nr:spore coat protein [Perspicuibacillus lycopersici]MCU9615058.1 spore coat protein [Perspicuibacillus lycopersici]
MLNDYLDPIHSKGMPDQADSAIAMDFLITAKTGVRNYAIALTEATSPEVKAVLRNQLKSAIQLQTEIYQLMMEKEWFHPYDLPKQFEIDLRSAELAVQIASLPLFPKDTDRLGTFATPEN